MKPLPVAQGRWQFQQLCELLEAGEIPARPRLRGRARLFERKYEQSLDHMIERLRKFKTVEYVPGPRGGRWSAVYRVSDLVQTALPAPETPAREVATSRAERMLSALTRVITVARCALSARRVTL